MAGFGLVFLRGASCFLKQEHGAHESSLVRMKTMHELLFKSRGPLAYQLAHVLPDLQSVGLGGGF